MAVGKKVDLSLVLPDAMYDEMSSLLGQIDEVLSRWAASAPVEKRNRLNEKRGGDIITVSKGTQQTAPHHTPLTPPPSLPPYSLPSRQKT